MTKPILRLCGVLTILALAACSQAAKSPQAATTQMPGTMTDPATGGVVIAGPVLIGTAPRTPGKTLSTAPLPSPAARTAAEFDTTTREQKAVAAAAPVKAERKLGSTIASLGDPSLPGFWIKTPLTQSETEGRIVNPANGKSAKVRLIPAPGPASGGSQVSLPALQLIGVSLTDLPMVEVYGG